ncbi:Tn3 family transposase, partial [Aquabacterium sp.]|uniref:Tn3 family transposase n=1 Tax=Aquabacterium sp. TaxID=1872578 RepID=UPI00345BB350
MLPAQRRQELQQLAVHRLAGLNLVTAAIVLWNTVYLERAANALRGHGQAVD